MKNNYDRHTQIYQQLEWFHPTKEINIWYNKGFRDCKKLDQNGLFV